MSYSPFVADQVVPGELTVVTGVPNSGKSEWIDALLCNLNHSVGWKFALCSMENKVCFWISHEFGRKNCFILISPDWLLFLLLAGTRSWQETFRKTCTETLLWCGVSFSPFKNLRLVVNFVRSLKWCVMNHLKLMFLSTVMGEVSHGWALRSWMKGNCG